MRHVAQHHGKILVLRAIIEPEPQPEPVGERHLFFDRFARVDRGRRLVVDHVARHEMAPVGRRIEDDIAGPPFDAAFEHGLQRLVARVVAVKRQVVAKHDEAMLRGPHVVQRAWQGCDILAMDFDELQVALFALELHR